MFSIEGFLGCEPRLQVDIAVMAVVVHKDDGCAVSPFDKSALKLSHKFRKQGSKLID